MYLIFFTTSIRKCCHAFTATFTSPRMLHIHFGLFLSLVWRIEVSMLDARTDIDASEASTLLFHPIRVCS
jgi:hypothetical protein